MGEIAVRVRLVGQKATRRVRLPQKTDVAGLLGRLGHDRETVVVRLNGRIVPEEERLAGGDIVEILQVVTGG